MLAFSAAMSDYKEDSSFYKSEISWLNASVNNSSSSLNWSNKLSMMTRMLLTNFWSEMMSLVMIWAKTAIIPLYLGWLNLMLDNLACN